MLQVQRDPFPVRLNRLKQALKDGFSPDEYEAAIFGMRSDKTIRKNTPGVVDLSGLRANILELRAAQAKLPSITSWVSYVISVVASSLWRSGTSCASTAKDISKTTNINVSRILLDFSGFFVPRVKADRAAMRNQYRCLVSEFVERLEPSPDKNAVAHHRVGVGKWISHPIVFRKMSWARLFDE
jgi:hypothetical protein